MMAKLLHVMLMYCNNKHFKLSSFKIQWFELDWGNSGYRRIHDEKFRNHHLVEQVEAVEPKGK